MSFCARPGSNRSFGVVVPVATHPRVTELTFSSRAAGGVVHVDVLTPVGYDPTGATLGTLCCICCTGTVAATAIG